MTKIIDTMMALLLVVLIVLVSCSNETIDVVNPSSDVASLYNDCTSTQHNDTYIDFVPVRNGTYGNGTQRVSYVPTNTTRYWNTTSCRQKLDVGGRVTDILNRGYVCSEDASYIYCDSVRDGNGDGVCDARGGETCCRIVKLDGGVICKNSAEPWVSTRVEVERLAR